MVGVKFKLMKWIMFWLTIIILGGCSVTDRIQWHEDRLDYFEQKYPDRFSTVTLDSIINARALSLASKMILSLDSNKWKDLYKQVSSNKAKADSAINLLRQKGITDCDSAIKYIALDGKVKTKIITVYEKGKCVIMPKKLDTLGIQIQIMGINGEVDISVKVDSMHIKKDCPPCFTPPPQDEARFWQFWQFWAALILPTLFYFLFFRVFLFFKISNR